MANNLLINNLSSFFSHIDKDAPSSPRIEQPPLYEFTSCEPPVFPKIRALICPPFYVSTSVSISSFIFSRTTHSLSPADQAHCKTKRLAQCLCCACTHMYIFILFYILCTFLYVLFGYFIFLYLSRASNLEIIYTECFRIIFENFDCGLIWLISRSNYNKKKYV